MYMLDRFALAIVGTKWGRTELRFNCDDYSSAMAVSVPLRLRQSGGSFSQAFIAYDHSFFGGHR
jgi:hypothetical protein